jgi:IAA-amino acid hydrolase
MERFKLVQLFFCVVILQAVRGLSDARLAEYMQESSKEQDWLVGIRRELHQWPELMYEEHNTSLFLRKALDDLDIPYK